MTPSSPGPVAHPPPLLSKAKPHAKSRVLFGFKNPLDWVEAGVLLPPLVLREAL